MTDVTPDERSVPTQEIIGHLNAALEPFGGAAEDRETAILWLLTAEMLRMPRFGIAMLHKELGRFRGQKIVPVPNMSQGAVSDLDAAGMPGVLALARASRTVIERVEDGGVAVVGIRNVGATGILGCAARQIATHGAIALVTAESGPVVAPWGGAAPAIGTNPLALGVPRQEQVPFVIDFATSPMTLAAVRDRQEQGLELPDGVAVDRDGAPTTDPDALGALLPESKIASLVGLMVQMLAGVATGSASDAGGRFGLRGVSLIAFRPPNAAAAHDSSALLERWQSAGGHVPSRMDAAPARLADLPAGLNLSPHTLAALHDLTLPSL